MSAVRRDDESAGPAPQPAHVEQRGAGLRKLRHVLPRLQRQRAAGENFRCITVPRPLSAGQNCADPVTIDCERNSASSNHNLCGIIALVQSPVEFSLTIALADCPRIVHPTKIAIPVHSATNQTIIRWSKDTERYLYLQSRSLSSRARSTYNRDVSPIVVMALGLCGAVEKLKTTSLRFATS